jgi:hypothetical protein
LATGVPLLALGYFLAGGMRTARYMVTAHVDTLVRRTEMGLAYGMAETAQAGALALAPVCQVLYQISPALPTSGPRLIALMYHHQPPAPGRQSDLTRRRPARPLRRNYLEGAMNHGWLESDHHLAAGWAMG